eukprot:s16_g16.t1
MPSCWWMQTNVVYIRPWRPSRCCERKASVSVPPFLPPLVEWATRDGRVFFKRRDISFSPIPRNQKGEASDTAIEAKLAQLAQSKRDTCMALLTCDNDFVEQVRQIAALRKNDMWVFVPVNGDASLHSSLRRYKETGAHAVPLATSVIQAERQRSGQRTKVRAILEPDGHGSVKMGQPGSNPVHGRAAVDQLRTFLQDLGYCDARAERGHLLQSVAKFWFVNRLGRLTAYPTQNAFDAACEVLQASNRQHSWARCRNDHAFFLPMTCGGSSTKTTLREYGGKTQKQVFEGGGPFMIKDSASMVAQALQRMGYLDEVYNSDLPEALLLFVNRPVHYLARCFVHVRLVCASRCSHRRRNRLAPRHGRWSQPWRFWRRGGGLDSLRPEEMIERGEDLAWLRAKLTGSCSYSRSHKEQNLTTKDIYGQDVIDAFFKTEGDVLSEQIAIIQDLMHDYRNHSLPESEVQAALEELEEVLHQVDHAGNLHKMGGMQPMLDLALGTDREDHEAFFSFGVEGLRS